MSRPVRRYPHRAFLDECFTQILKIELARVCVAVLGNEGQDWILIQRVGGNERGEIWPYDNRPRGFRFRVLSWQIYRFVGGFYEVLLLVVPSKFPELAIMVRPQSGEEGERKIVDQDSVSPSFRKPHDGRYFLGSQNFPEGLRCFLFIEFRGAERVPVFNGVTVVGSPFEECTEIPDQIVERLWGNASPVSII